MTPQQLAIGIDVGGTFTDIVVAGPHGTLVAKAPTTPHDQSEAILAGLAQAAARLGLTLETLLAGTARLVHGTTVATNALLEGKGARVGMLVTKGHRDTIELREGLKPNRYDLRMPPPIDLVPRALRLPVIERLRADGTTAIPLDPATLESAIDALEAAAVQSVAICFLHAWRNPAHEHQAARAVQRRMPDIPVSCSADVLPEIKEFERFSTTVANALVAPLVRDYLARLERRLQAAGLAGPIFIILSHGGVASVAEAARLAAATALSGPAGGVAAGIALAQTATITEKPSPPGRGLGEGPPPLRPGQEPPTTAAEPSAPASLITFDMGGTSTDIAVLRAGQPAIGAGRGVGPVRIALPSLDIVTLAAGGGSIAAIGPDGLLRVGPHSAGAVPGPACYGRGGIHPTVTDANLVLGYLDPAAGLGGQALDPAAAARALQTLGDRLGLDPVAAAAGIHRVVTARMADGVRVATVQRGVDPRAFHLLSFGGAAGLHCAAVAEALGIRTVLIPWQASVLSAWGMLNTDLAVQLAAGAPQHGGIDPAALHQAYATLAHTAASRLAWFEGSLAFSRSADLRYGEQVFEIPVNLDGIDLEAPGARAAIEARFHARHEARFTYALPGQEVVLTTLRLAATGQLPRLSPAMPTPPPPAPRTTRKIHLDGWHDAPVHDFAHLSPEWMNGPALVTSNTTTILIRPTDQARLNPQGWLELAITPGPKTTPPRP